MLVVRLPLGAAAIANLFFLAPALAADRLILRNLEIITDRAVLSLDEDGIVLNAAGPGGSDRLMWSQIERGKIALDQQRFDQLLGELGLPLYRIGQRLKVGDYEALAEPAELLYPRFSQRKSQTAYLVCQATMWSRLAAGRREEAVEPYLRCFELLRSGAARSASLPGSRRLQADPATAVSPELVPVWFDAAAASSALPGLQEVIRAMSQPRPQGVYIYYVSLALAAGDQAEAERVMGSLRGESAAIAAWRDLLSAQQEMIAGAPGAAVRRLRTASGELPQAGHLAALYWLGLADAQSSDETACRDGILALLTLPAAYGDEQPELAAAGLYHAAAALAKLKDERGAAALRNELTTRYAGTRHASTWQSERKSSE
jgi:hypothetical protein